MPLVSDNELQCCINDCSMSLDQQYWNTQYVSHHTGWDLHVVSPPLKGYIDQLVDKNIRILIPGCGNAYEAEYLLQQGFSNVHLLDIAPKLVESLQHKFHTNKHIQIILGDFFTHQGTYDLILEQTFFCALNPSLRKDYAKAMYHLLAENGKLVGVLFDKKFDKSGPPFGGCKCEYETFFSPYFQFSTFSSCFNSIASRQHQELFINFQRK